MLVREEFEVTFIPIFWRGAGVETYWHQHDARLTGFAPQAPGMAPGVDSLMQHVARATVNSPFISLTRSYGVARDYALHGGRAQPTEDMPGYVYEIEINIPPPGGLQLLDPVKEVAADAPPPLNPVSYQHDGDQDFLLGLVSLLQMGQSLRTVYPQPPPAGGTARTPNLTIQLETLVRALRDAEVLAAGNIPSTCVRSRTPVWPLSLS